MRLSPQARCTLPMGSCEAGTDGSWTLRWRKQSRANSSLKSCNSLLGGKIQGNSSILTSEIRIFQRKRAQDQRVTGEFPYAAEQEIIGPEQGIKSAHQANFPPHQGSPRTVRADLIADQQHRGWRASKNGNFVGRLARAPVGGSAKRVGTLRS